MVSSVLKFINNEYKDEKDFVKEILEKLDKAKLGNFLRTHFDFRHFLFRIIHSGGSNLESVLEFFRKNKFVTDTPENRQGVLINKKTSEIVFYKVLTKDENQNINTSYAIFDYEPFYVENITDTNELFFKGNLSDVIYNLFKSFKIDKNSFGRFLTFTDLLKCR